MASANRRQAWQAIEAAIAVARGLAGKQAGPASGGGVNREQLVAAQRASEALRQRTEEAERRVVEAESRYWEVLTERDAALHAAAQAAANQGLVEAERDALRFALTRAEAERDAALAAKARAESAAAANQRVVADNQDRDLDRMVLTRQEAAAAHRTELRVEHEGVLAVRATMGSLLPASLDRHLVAGARVLRQDGRLAALVAVPCEAGGRMSAAANEQAGLLVAQGFRVDWLEEDELAS